MLTPDEKRARRKFRHEIQKRYWKVAARRIGMMARPAQLHEAARTMTDRYMHLVDHHQEKLNNAPGN